MRLIDADALLKHEIEADRMGAMLVVGKGYILDAPTIDAVQVVRGEWLQHKTAIGKTYSVCSECKTDFKFLTDRETLARLDMNGTNYCPNCGAKMEDKPLTLDELRGVLDEAESAHPYKVIGDYDTYSEYNEGWNDALCFIDSRLVPEGSEK